MAAKLVKLESSDDKLFEVDEAVAFESQMLKNMIEDMGVDGPIFLPKVSSKVLAKVIEYCEHQVVAKAVENGDKTTQDNPATPEDEIKAWGANFVKANEDILSDLNQAADILDIKSLLDLTKSEITNRDVIEALMILQTPHEEMRISSAINIDSRSGGGDP